MLYDHNSKQHLLPGSANHRRPQPNFNGNGPLLGPNSEEINNSRFYRQRQPDSNQMIRSSQMDNIGSPNSRRSNSALGGHFGQQMNNRSYANDLPVRMVINAKYVGALIGQGGANIRQICHSSKAKCVIDVTRSIREGTGHLVEKAVNIYGSPANYSSACMKILEIILRETRNDPTNQGKNVEPELKLLAHNNLIGRLIGKHGSTIKKIMEETSCVIFISNYNELSRFNVERTITVRGPTLQNVCAAQTMISERLRSTWESDMKNPQTRAMYGIPVGPLPPVNPFLHNAAGFPMPAYGTPAQHMNPFTVAVGAQYRPPLPPPPPPFVGMRPGLAASPRPDILRHAQPAKMTPMAHLTNNSGASPASYSGTNGERTPVRNSSDETYHSGRTGNATPFGRDLEISYVWVPGSAVGALIGTQGSNIRKIMRSSGARIHIDSPKPGATGTDSTKSENDQSPNAQVLRQVASANEVAAPSGKQTERRVIIMGTEVQQYKSQFWVFHRLSEDHYVYFDSLRLCIDIPVPGTVVGRIIGKKGQNIKELQRYTGAQVRLIGNRTTEESTRPDHMFLRIVGNFNAAQVVQTRVRQLVRSAQVEENRRRQRETASTSVKHEADVENVDLALVAAGGSVSPPDSQHKNMPECEAKSSSDGRQGVIPNHVPSSPPQQQYPYLHQNGPSSSLNSIYTN